jgi:hypothetical protein
LDSVRDRVLGKGVHAPACSEVKDFLRFYGLQSKGRINKHASAESIKSQAEFFFAGFTRVTGTQTVEEERSEVYWVCALSVVLVENPKLISTQWSKRVLPLEGDIVDERLPKYNFTREDLDQTLLTLWTRKDLIYISERDRVEFTFLIHSYCWTGARIGAFFNGKGLRYKVCLRVISGPLSA